MRTPRVDLTTCDDEPIHLIGSIQPDGALVAVDAGNLRVSYASANLSEFLDVSAEEALDLPLSSLLGASAVRIAEACPHRPEHPNLHRPRLFEIARSEADRFSVELMVHRNENHIIFEIQPASRKPAEIWNQDTLRQRIVTELVNPKSMDALASTTAEIVREATGFDRVMIYKFADDGHGEVIAESTEREDSFLGLHYPASDIPEPARRHFRLNLVRVISDIESQASPIQGLPRAVQPDAEAAPLDLTFSKLRAVAPVHIEYLRNMGVRASMSISLVSGSKLWGLVACHHYSAHHLSSSQISFCEILGGAISALLQSLENTVLLERRVAAERMAHELETSFDAHDEVSALVEAHAVKILSLFGAQGLVLRIGGTVRSVGAVPGIQMPIRFLAGNAADGIMTTENLSTHEPLDDEQVAMASGAAYWALSEDNQDWLVLMREEYEHEIRWAGKPEKPEQIGSDGVARLSPRGSFALWRQERRGYSRPFTRVDHDAMGIVRRALFALNSLYRERVAMAAQERAEAEKTRLMLSLLGAERQSSMGELAGALAHELNQPLAAVVNFVNACRQELVNSKLPISDDIERLMDDAVDESSRAADLVRRLRAFIVTGELRRETCDLHAVIAWAAELAVVSHDGSEKIRLHTKLGPEALHVVADTVQIGQVILNLVRNSIAATDTSLNHITLSAERTEESVIVSVKDTGKGIPVWIRDSLFEPFHGSTTKGMGMGLSLCRSIIEAHNGKIWLESAEVGTEVRFSLPLTTGADLAEKN
ncbi:MAG: ATP-binding protein [Pseudomonadota bacterium]